MIAAFFQNVANTLFLPEIFPADELDLQIIFFSDFLRVFS